MEQERTPEIQSLGAMEYQNLTLGQGEALKNENFYRFIGQADRNFQLTSEPRVETIVFPHVPRRFENDQFRVRFARVYVGEPPYARNRKGYIIGEHETPKYEGETVFHQENEAELHNNEEVDRISVRITLPREKFMPSFDSEIHVLIVVK